jgi:hypothetical protein
MAYFSGRSSFTYIPVLDNVCNVKYLRHDLPPRGCSVTKLVETVITS